MCWITSIDSVLRIFSPKVGFVLCSFCSSDCQRLSQMRMIQVISPRTGNVMLMKASQFCLQRQVTRNEKMKVRENWASTLVDTRIKRIFIQAKCFGICTYSMTIDYCFYLFLNYIYSKCKCHVVSPHEFGYEKNCIHTVLTEILHTNML